jgi:hypothetical protein
MSKQRSTTQMRQHTVFKYVYNRKLAVTIYFDTLD